MLIVEAIIGLALSLASVAVFAVAVRRFLSYRKKGSRPSNKPLAITAMATASLAVLVAIGVVITEGRRYQLALKGALLLWALAGAMGFQEVKDANEADKGSRPSDD